MKQNVEIFCGAGAMAALEVVAIRAVLGAQGIPSRGGRMRVVVASRHYARAAELMAAAFGQRDAVSAAAKPASKENVAGKRRLRAFGAGR